MLRIAIPLMFVLAGSAAFADDGAASRPARPKPCAQDVKQLCADVKPGGGRILACLREHHADVSPGCKAALKQQREGKAGDGKGGGGKTDDSADDNE